MNDQSDSVLKQHIAINSTNDSNLSKFDEQSNLDNLDNENKNDKIHSKKFLSNISTNETE